MATYSTIKGFNVQVLSADPPAPGVGQVWYNTTTGTMKGYGQIGTGAWASGGAVNTQRSQAQGVGTTTAGLILGGDPPASVGTLVESYNGTSWTTSPVAMNTGHSAAMSSGTQTSAIVVSGFSSDPTRTVNCEIWNGSTWTETGNVTTARSNAYPSIAGTVTATLVAAGNSSPSVLSTNVELFNGTAWTETTDVNEGKKSGAGAGTQTDCLIWSGYPPAYGSEVWNGTTWTEITDMGQNRYDMGNSGATSTAAMGAGGTYPPGNRLTIVEAWDGSSWTEVADLSSQREGQGGAGTTMAAFVATGLGPAGTGTTVTEEWAVPTTTKTFSSS